MNYFFFKDFIGVLNLFKLIINYYGCILNDVMEIDEND